MSTEKPKKPFNLAAGDQNDKLRDKDNAQPVLKPKVPKSEPRQNLAPPGMMGIKRGLSGKTEQEKPKKRFAMEQKGELTKTFKPIAAPSDKKDRGFER